MVRHSDVSEFKVTKGKTIIRSRVLDSGSECIVVPFNWALEGLKLRTKYGVLFTEYDE